MSTKALERVVELWPSLSDEARSDIVELAEGAAAPAGKLRDLSPYEEEMIARSIEDFKQGRYLTSEEYRIHMDIFFRSLRRRRRHEDRPTLEDRDRGSPSVAGSGVAEIRHARDHG